MIDWTKPIETTNGEKWVYLEAMPGSFRYHWVCVWRDRPRHWDPQLKHESELRNVPEKRRLEGWVQHIPPLCVYRVSAQRER